MLVLVRALALLERPIVSQGLVYAHAILSASSSNAVHFLARNARRAKDLIASSPVVLQPIRLTLLGTRSKSTRPQTLLIPASNVHHGEDLTTVPASIDYVLITTSSAGLRHGGGRWVRDLANSCPGATFICLTPGAEDLDFIMGLGVERSRLGGGFINLMSWNAPLPGQKFETVGREAYALAEKEGRGGEVVVAGGKTDEHVLAYFVPSGQGLFMYDQSEDGRLKRLVEAFKKGGLGCSKATREQGAAALFVGECIAMPLLIGLESVNWEFKRLARNDDGALKAVCKASQGMLSRRRWWMTWFLSFLITPFMLMIVASIAPWLLKGVVDLEAFIKYHFSKVGDQTKLLADNALEAENHAALDGLRALTKKNKRWAAIEEIN
ncbi:hypothetical protein HK101_009381 [Irineochytrium annulatum]|nr:hypothetical protein HK101_009381 [Irineochytrium annulatum]